MEVPRRVAFDNTGAAEVTRERTDRRGLARDRRACEPAGREIREVPAQGAVIERRRIGAAAALAPRDKLARVVLVRAARVLTQRLERRDEVVDRPPGDR